MSENAACYDSSWAQCSAVPRNTPNCPGSAPVQIQESKEKHYFGFTANSETGEFWATFADATGTVHCARECYCYTEFANGIYLCSVGGPVYNADGDTIDYYKDYYISAGCDPVI